MIELNKTGEWLVGILGRETAGRPIGELLRDTWKLPKKTVHLLFQQKEILLDGLPVPQHAMVAEGQEIRLRLCQPEAFGLDPVAQPLNVLYEDDHALVVNKPAGLLLHPTEKGDIVTLDHIVAGYFAKHDIYARVRHVHRLDQDTSGAVLYAKHALASALLDEQLRLRRIKRSYVAFAHGKIAPDSGTIDQPIGKDRHHPQRRRVSPQGDFAITHFQVLKRFSSATKIECQLETGRTHQIRVHLSYLGHPLLGDTLYGGKSAGINRQALHAAKLQFFDPFAEKEIRVSSDLPAELLRLEQSLGG